MGKCRRHSREFWAEAIELDLFAAALRTLQKDRKQSEPNRFTGASDYP